MSDRNKGFKGILLSSLFGKCEVSFGSSPKKVEENDENFYYIEIINGHGHILEELDDSDSNEEKDDNFINVLIFNGKIQSYKHNNSNNEDDDFDNESYLSQLKEIYQYFELATRCLYETPIEELCLEFNIFKKTKNIKLMNGFVVTTPNSLTSFVFQNIERGEEQFIDFFVSFVSFKPEHGVCYSMFPDCSKPTLKISILHVMFYFIKRKFPDIDPSMLYSLLKRKLNKTNSNRDVKVCIKCVHLYTLENREKQCKKSKFIGNATDATFPYDITRPAHIYMKPAPIRAPPKPREAKTAPFYTRNTVRSAYTRLSKGKPSHKAVTSRTFRVANSWPIRKRDFIQEPIFCTEESSAIKEAQKIYGGSPFNVKKWSEDEIVFRFHSKMLTKKDRMLIDPRHCNITKFIQ